MALDTAGRARNRSISAFVAAFATISLVASVLPLLPQGTSDQSLLPGLGRGTSFGAYCVFLLLFVFFFLPGSFRADRGRSLLPWAPLAGFGLLFASIPGIVSAYISGVARPQALFMAGLIASACAVVLLLRAFLGRSAVPVAFLLGGLTLFAIPAIEAMAWSTGTPLRVALSDLSLVTWLRRLAFVREPVDPKGILICAGVLWLLVAAAAARRGRAVMATAAGCFAILAPALTEAAPPDVAIRPVLGRVARAGVRIPFAISARGGGTAVEVAFRSETLRVPADGQSYPALVVLAQGESEAEIVVDGVRSRVPLDLEWADPARPVLGVIGPTTFGDAVATIVPGAEVMRLDGGALPAVAGALEMMDAIVIESGPWESLLPARRATLEAYAALGGLVAIVGSPAETRADSRPAISGVRRLPAAWDLTRLPFRRSFVPDAFDKNVLSLFLPPDWQALDLTKLLLFLAAYHVAFFVAFLLPLLLDSHKSSAVYLVSVGTVLIVVVVVAWWSLRQFFLRDNQVYTQSLTYATIPAGGGDAAVRQFRSYASMSGERRDFPWPSDRDLARYRDSGSQSGVLDLGRGPSLTDVWLDRFGSKLLVREDLVGAAPIELAPEGTGFRVRPVPGVPDPLGFRLARLTGAAVIEPDNTVRSAAVEGDRILVREAGAGPAARPLDAFERPLIGPRFLREEPGNRRRIVLIRASGVARLDDTGGFFKTSDVDAVIAFEVER